MIRRLLAPLLAMVLGSLGGSGLPDPAAIEKRAADPRASRAALERDAPGYAWDLFLWLNSPLAGPGPRTWETTFRQTSTIYLPEGRKPAPWGAETGPCGPGVHDLDSSMQVDGFTLLDKWGSPVRYQILMNESAFDYILDRDLYSVNGQEAAAASGLPISFPGSAHELKTSWIWIGQDAAKRAELQGKYHIADACYQVFDDKGRPTGWQKGAAALAGLHIANKLLPTWVWITFENVYNDQFTRAKLELPVAGPVQAANQSYQQRLQAAGSVLANYRLIGIQTDYTEPGFLGDRTPSLLANSTMESAFQSQSSCVTCHGTAAIHPEGRYFNSGMPVGAPPDLHGKGFVPLDFVWSMKRATRAR
jgi:hypothetical protein